MATTGMDVADVLAHGAQWLGRTRMEEASFKNQFGVYPSTVLFVLHMVPSCVLPALLRTLYFMKEYPTEEQIKNMRVSPSYYRRQVWACARALHDGLPEVSVSLFFFALFFFSKKGGGFCSYHGGRGVGSTRCRVSSQPSLPSSWIQRR